MPSYSDRHDLQIASLGGYRDQTYYINTKVSLFFFVIFWLAIFAWMVAFANDEGDHNFLVLSIISFFLYYFFETSFFKKCYQKGLEIDEMQKSERQEKHMQAQKEYEESRRANEIKAHKDKEEKRKSTLKIIRKCIETGSIKKLKQAIELTKKLEQEKQSGFMFGETIVGIDKKSGLIKELETEAKIELAKQHEKLMEFDEAAEIYKELELEDEVIKVRKLKAEQGAVKVTQKVVHGDEITKTEIKDSVLHRSNVGGKSSKAKELREAKSLFEEGLIDDNEFKQMKKEILGK